MFLPVRPTFPLQFWSHPYIPVPNPLYISLLDHCRNGFRVLPTSWIPGDRTGNVCLLCPPSIDLKADLKNYSENPFNYDLNDLGSCLSLLDLVVSKVLISAHLFIDLDAFCKSLQRELHEITAVSPLFFPVFSL